VISATDGNCWASEFLAYRPKNTHFDYSAYRLKIRLNHQSSPERKTTMTIPMEKLFEELGAKVLEQTMCDNCLDEFPEEEMYFDPNVRDGKPVCKECYEFLTN
jgi:formylmethanofuran dehydrogenase subunit E